MGIRQDIVIGKEASPTARTTGALAWLQTADIVTKGVARHIVTSARKRTVFLYLLVPFICT